MPDRPDPRWGEHKGALGVLLEAASRLAPRAPRHALALPQDPPGSTAWLLCATWRTAGRPSPTPHATPPQGLRTPQLARVGPTHPGRRRRAALGRPAPRPAPRPHASPCRGPGSRGHRLRPAARGAAAAPPGGSGGVCARRRRFRPAARAGPHRPRRHGPRGGSEAAARVAPRAPLPPRPRRPAAPGPCPGAPGAPMPRGARLGGCHRSARPRCPRPARRPRRAAT